MSVVHVKDLAYVRLQSPDLDKAEEFLTNLGMVRSARTADRLYMRGTDPSHHIHVTHLGPPKYLGLAFWVDGEDELKSLSQVSGATGIEDIDEPGGGRRVRLTDPHGYQIEAVCGIEELPRLPIRRNVLNWGDEKVRRAGELMRLDSGPSQIKRIAHALLMTPKLHEVIKWYQGLFGFVCSDEVYAGSRDHVIDFQSLRPRRGFRRSSHLRLHPKRQGRPQSRVVRGPEHR
jgi:catechol 2,3-dioxygenase-like lactoylglutathione lyase family enzyme